MCLEGCLHVLGAGLNVLDTGLNVLDVESARAWASFSACAAFLTHSYACKGNFPTISSLQLTTTTRPIDNDDLLHLCPIRPLQPGEVSPTETVAHRRT